MRFDSVGRAAAALLAANLAVPVFASLPEWAPYSPQESPRRFPLDRCPGIELGPPAEGEATPALVYGPEGSTRLVTREEAPHEGVVVEVRGPGGELLAGPAKASAHPPMGRREEGWCADLNGDGRLDLALALGSAGNGLGGSFHDLVLALSDGTRYRLWVVPTMDPGEHDFFDLDGDGRVEVLQTTFASNDAQDEGQRHSYWVYHLYEVAGGGLVPADSLDARFPKWVWFTGRENHAPARRLTAADRERMWSRYGHAPHEVGMARPVPRKVTFDRADRTREPSPCPQRR